MKQIKKRSVVRIDAFTLIEMLTVIGIIAILAALIVPAMTSAGVKQRINRAQTEMSQIETAIESYKSARGHYPPDNPASAATNQLFYELTGTVYQQTSYPRTYRRINGVETITESTFPGIFGPDVKGFINSSYVDNVNDKAKIQEAEARDYFPNIKPGQYSEIAVGGGRVVLMTLPINGPEDAVSVEGRRVNPWHYNSSNPTNNPNSYDLWIDLSLRNKTQRICNWSDTPLIVN